MSPYELVFRHRATISQEFGNKAKCCFEWNIYTVLWEIEEESEVYER